jgi:Tfp pilus assembly protein PilF
MRTRPLDEATVVAMFMNNRAAEALARDATDDAYWWARAGLLADPDFAGVINTLGVIYQRGGHAKAAEQVFAALLSRQPNHTQALHNLAMLLEQQGRKDEAAALQARLAALEPEPPYHWFVQGQQALRRGDARSARDYFTRGARADYSSEFHSWLRWLTTSSARPARRATSRARGPGTSRNERDFHRRQAGMLNQHRH